jgi:hypothetical protein
MRLTTPTTAILSLIIVGLIVKFRSVDWAFLFFAPEIRTKFYIASTSYLVLLSDFTQHKQYLCGGFSLKISLTVEPSRYLAC